MIDGIDRTACDEMAKSDDANFGQALMTVNHSTEVWGPDADRFVPERHLSLADTSSMSGEERKRKNVPGVWGNTLTFLGGMRNCIGYKFALAEMKVGLLLLLLMPFPYPPRCEMSISDLMTGTAMSRGE